MPKVQRTDHHATIMKGLTKRKRVEAFFKGLGVTAIAIALALLLWMLLSITYSGVGVFKQSYIYLDIEFDPLVLEMVDPRNPDQLAFANFDALIQAAMLKRFEGSKPKDARSMASLVSVFASFTLRDALVADPDLMRQTQGFWLLADDDADLYYRHHNQDSVSRLSPKQQVWMDGLVRENHIERRFNRLFFSSGDSSEPEAAGILGALMGSFYTLLVTFILSFPIGVASAVYLEEYAPKSALSDFIEVSINNLAAVPSVIFGLLGLAIFLNVFGMPRSVPLVGGMVLTLMTLPTMIIISRAAIKSVPSGVRQAALSMGASKMQMILHHVLPLAMPGMLTGAIIGMAQALGETAPLLMIGMIAFIVDIPNGVLDPATVLPVQIFLWADAPERAFIERSSAAIIVLLLFLVLMNGAAIYLRRKLQRRL